MSDSERTTDAKTARCAEPPAKPADIFKGDERPDGSDERLALRDRAKSRSAFDSTTSVATKAVFSLALAAGDERVCGIIESVDTARTGVGDGAERS
jgi:hypothetical protein